MAGTGWINNSRCSSSGPRSPASRRCSICRRDRHRQRFRRRATTLDVVFDNVPDDGAGRTPAAERFAVQANGMDVAVSSVTVTASDKRVRLTLATTIKQDQSVTVSYRDPTAGDDTAALQSPAGVDAPSFANYRVSNDSTVPDPSPKPVSATVPPAGGTVDVVFNHAPDDRFGTDPGGGALHRESRWQGGRGKQCCGIGSGQAGAPDAFHHREGRPARHGGLQRPDPRQRRRRAAGRDRRGRAELHQLPGDQRLNGGQPGSEAGLGDASGKQATRSTSCSTVALNDGTGQTPTADRFTVKAAGTAVTVTGVEVASIETSR